MIETEPHYEDEEELGRPAWSRPETDKEKYILSSVRRQYYGSKKERNAVKEIVNTPGKYPWEWVKNCCTWASRTPVGLGALVSLIKNEQRQWRWAKNRPSESQSIGGKNFD